MFDEFFAVARAAADAGFDVSSLLGVFREDESGVLHRDAPSVCGFFALPSVKMSLQEVFEREGDLCRVCGGTVMFSSCTLKDWGERFKLVLEARAVLDEGFSDMSTLTRAFEVSALLARDYGFKGVSSWARELGVILSDEDKGALVQGKLRARFLEAALEGLFVEPAPFKRAGFAKTREAFARFKRSEVRKLLKEPGWVVVDYSGVKNFSSGGFDLEPLLLGFTFDWSKRLAQLPAAAQVLFPSMKKFLLAEPLDGSEMGVFSAAYVRGPAGFKDAFKAARAV